MADTIQRNDLIYLTGFMGSGKTTIGPILANTLGYDFSDADKLIEQRVGKSVNEIFRNEGENFFRKIEQEVVEVVSGFHRHVVSLGGGTMSNPINFNVIRESGIIVYLHSSPEHLIQRLQTKTDRPILSNSEGERLDPPRLRERILQLYADRSPVYAQSHITIDTDEKKVGITVDEIVKRLSGLVK